LFKACLLEYYIYLHILYFFYRSLVSSSWKVFGNVMCSIGCALCTPIIWILRIPTEESETETDFRTGDSETTVVRGEFDVLCNLTFCPTLLECVIGNRVEWRSRLETLIYLLNILFGTHTRARTLCCTCFHICDYFGFIKHTPCCTRALEQFEFGEPWPEAFKVIISLVVCLKM